MLVLPFHSEIPGKGTCFVSFSRPTQGRNTALPQKSAEKYCKAKCKDRWESRSYEPPHKIIRTKQKTGQRGTGCGTKI